MAAMSHDERMNRLEQVVQVLAEDQVSLSKLIAELATETRRGFDRVAEQFAETDRRLRDRDERLHQTDERIDKLVLAIAELIRNPNQQKPS